MTMTSFRRRQFIRLRLVRGVAGCFPRLRLPRCWRISTRGVGGADGMLKKILESARLDLGYCADLIRVGREPFADWVEGRAPLPAFAQEELSTILGVPEKVLISDAPRANDPGSLAPALWYKLRGDRFSAADRELAGMIRKLGFQWGQLRRILNDRASVYRSYFNNAIGAVDRNAPPAVQGRIAAQAFRRASGLHRSGGDLRGLLRASGVFVIESPLRKSSVDGSVFNVGLEEQTPCLFANTFQSTWLRRSSVLAHELGHAVFDLENDPFHADFRGAAGSGFREVRANAFARELLIPRSLLDQLQSAHALRWDALSESQLRLLVTTAHVELAEILNAAVQYGLIDSPLADRYRGVPIAVPVRRAKGWTVAVNGNRFRLPEEYVRQVLTALADGKITEGRAAEMLFMDRYRFRERFEAVAA